MKSVEIKLESLYDASTEELRSKKKCCDIIRLIRFFKQWRN
jgi:hypothetical protein